MRDAICNEVVLSTILSLYSTFCYFKPIRSIFYAGYYEVAALALESY